MIDLKGGSVMSDGIVDVAATVAEKGVEAAGYVAGEALECACGAGKAVLEVGGMVLSNIVGTIVRSS